MPGSRAWLWMIPVLLLAVLLAGRKINSLSFTRDETYTLLTAGARNYGPYSVRDALQTREIRAPDQALGWTILANRWGAQAGWSTVALRAPAFFLGLLALAMVYRAGADLFDARVGIYAALLLASSSLFLQYMSISRANTPVVFFSALTLWGYWRLALRPSRAGRAGHAGFVFGGLGLLYSHYFAAFLLPALGSFHLFFVRKDRRWWLPVILGVLLFIAALPELLVVDAGVEHNVRRYSEVRRSMDLSETLGRLLFTMTNGVVRIPRLAGFLLLPVLPISIYVLYKTRPGRLSHSGNHWYPAFTAFTFFLLLMGVNHFVPVLFYNRIRYFMAIWPPLALLGASGIRRLEKRREQLASWVLASLVASGVIMFLYTQTYFEMDYHERTVTHLADQALERYAHPKDFLVLAEDTLPYDPQNRDYYLHVWEYPREIIGENVDADQLLRLALGHERVWLLMTDANNLIDEELSAEMHFCQRPVRRKGMVLTLYARGEADCA